MSYAINRNDDNTYDANNLVDKLSSIIISAASKSVPFKHAKLTKSYRKNKQKPKWVTKDCLLLRKEVRNLGKKVHKYPNNCELRHAFTNCRKEYNKLRKYLKSNFYNGIAEEINSLSPQNSKNFWSKIKENKLSKTNAEAVGISDFVDHYKSLLNTQYTDEDNSKYHYHKLDMKPNPLDYLFTEVEIKQGISKLKNGKKCRI